MDDKLIYIPNDNKQNYTSNKLKLFVKKFGHLSILTNQSIFNKSTQSLDLKNKKMLLNKLWVLV